MKPKGETFKTKSNLIFISRLSGSFLIFPDLTQYSEITPVKINRIYCSKGLSKYFKPRTQNSTAEPRKNPI